MKSFWSFSRRDVLKLLPSSVAGWLVGSPIAEKLARASGGASATAEAEGKKWVAKWIWCEGEPVPQNFYLYCRKAFVLEREATEATVDVTADSRYKLFVNGRFVGRGPARCDQRWQDYDSYDLRSLLHRGENIVSAIVHQYGAPSQSTRWGVGDSCCRGKCGSEVAGVHDSTRARLGACCRLRHGTGRVRKYAPQ